MWTPTSHPVGQGLRSVEIPLHPARTGLSGKGDEIRARSELNPLGAVRKCQQVDALAFLLHDGDSDGHGSRIAFNEVPPSS